MNWCVYSALRDCQNLHRDRLSDWLAIGYTATTTTTTTTPTPTPTPTNGITVSFPDRAIFFYSQIWKRMRSWANPSTSVATTLSITTSAATTATPLPLLHRGIFAFAFLHLTGVPRKCQKSVRNQSEISQKRAKRNLSLSLSLAYSLTLLPELLRLPLLQFPLPLLLLLLLVLLVLL